MDASVCNPVMFVKLLEVEYLRLVTFDKLAFVKFVPLKEFPLASMVPKFILVKSTPSKLGPVGKVGCPVVSTSVPLRNPLETK